MVSWVISAIYGECEELRAEIGGPSQSLGKHDLAQTGLSGMGNDTHVSKLHRIR